jgi:energy-coupling factor transporter transmembrane protein EcfT
MVSTGKSYAGSACALAIAAIWLIACGTPRRVVSSTLLLGFGLLLPYFLLVPLLPGVSLATTGDFVRALSLPWTILLRGLTGMLVCVGTVSVLSAPDLREALLRLPVPSMVSGILLQIVHQTAALVDETRRVAAAMAVRGASAGGVAALRVVFSLPQVWLPRVIDRAERIGAAMELRGYCDEPLPVSRRAAAMRADIIVLCAGASALALAVALRVLGAP